MQKVEELLKNRNSLSLLIFVFIASTVSVGVFPSQGDFATIFSFYIISYLTYVGIAIKSRITWKEILLVGIILRVIFIFIFPNLSDDIYRFVWDGVLISDGISPFGVMPSQLSELTTYQVFLLENMNSPDYFTIYPPMTQFAFYISTLGGEKIIYSSIIIKMIFFIAELGTFYYTVKLLDHLSKSRVLAALYFLNPLIIIEGIGNLHFEIIMVFFLSASVYYYFVRQKLFFAILLFVLSVATKLLPLMFLPFFIFREERSKLLKITVAGLIFFIILFSPLIIGFDVTNFMSSVDLYFQKFEFNASIYYLFRFIGKLASGYNLIHYIGPLLGVSTLLLIFKKAKDLYSNDLSSFLRFALYSFTIYLFLATTVHPWYLTVPIFLSIFHSYRYVIFWSLLIFISYINYSYEPYFENLIFIALEYTLLFGYIVTFERSAFKNYASSVKDTQGEI